MEIQRSITASPVEAREIDGKKVISGYAIVYDSLSQDLGGFQEIVRRGSIDASLKEIQEGKRSITARLQHMPGSGTIGNTANGTLTLRSDAKGLFYEAIPPDNVFGHAAWVAVKDGYITGSSFAFRVKANGQSWDYSTKPPTRELTALQLEDVAPVDGPAYLSATAEARSAAIASMREEKLPEFEGRKTGIEVRQHADGGKFVEMNIFDVLVPTWQSRYMADAMSSGKVGEILAGVPDAERIDVYINSPGGDAFEGIAIYNILKEHPAPVNVMVRGLAASAAGIVAMAGDSIQMGEGSFLMMHNASTITYGNAASFRKVARDLEKFDASMAKILSARSGNDIDKVTAWLADETWMDSDEAVLNGFADRKVSGDSATEEIDGERCRQLNYRNIPTSLGGSVVHSASQCTTMDEYREYIISRGARRRIDKAS